MLKCLNAFRVWFVRDEDGLMALIHWKGGDENGGKERELWLRLYSLETARKKPTKDQKEVKESEK